MMKRLLAILLVVSLVMPAINVSGGYTVSVLADDVVAEPENPLETEIPTESTEPEVTIDPSETIEPEDSQEPAESQSPDETVTPEPTATPEPVVYDLGDVDGSNVIEAADALSVLKHAAKVTELDYSSSVAADVDKSGVIDAQDALYVLQYAAKLIVRFVFTPEENFQVLKEYVLENGVVNKSGNKEISIDYVALGESTCVKEIESIQYDEKNDNFIYICEVEDPETKNTFKYRMKIDSENTNVSVNWTHHFINTSVEAYADSKYLNNQYTLAKTFTTDLDTYKYRSKVWGDLVTGERETWEGDLRKVYNAHVHAAMASFEDFLNRTVVMRLSDIYTSYIYSEETFFENVAYLFGIYPKILKVRELLINQLKDKGVYENGIYFTSKQGTDILGSVGYDTTTDTLYFDGFHYLVDENVYVYLYVVPFADRTSYLYAEVYNIDSNGELVLQSSGEQIISSVKMEYELTCIYPEGGMINNDIIQQSMSEVLKVVNNGILRYTYSYTLDRLGFTFL